MKKLKLIVSVIVSAFALSSCTSIFSMFGGKGSNSDAPANSTTEQVPSGEEMAKEATEFQLLNSDPAVIDAFSEYAEMVIEKTNNGVKAKNAIAALYTYYKAAIAYRNS